YLANLFLMLYWAIRWKAVFFLPALLLLIGMPKIKTFYHFPGGKATPEYPVRGDIKIMSYNVEGFLQYDAEKKRTTSARQIIDFIRENDPDIICFQEFQSTPDIPEEKINGWLEAWPYRTHYYTITHQQRGVWGPAIYSKFPILAEAIVPFEESRNGALWADVSVSGRDTLRIICNHLETTYVRENNILFLQPENFAADPDKTAQLRNIAGKLRKGFYKRAPQAETIARLIAERDVPTLVCGDFNDPPMSYTYQTIRNKFNDTFEDKGSGYGYTYKRLYRLMRIDYILASPHFETLSYETPDVEWSDHRPVIATLRKITD
ncbi:MAG: endonuclease/exonuclease/phosphatase family protein, partial [Rikenellaceae bacterium]|nr:endonuclease/exonuclease/phosphatase family protein [Rikenellaceae bacterium]